MRAEPVHQQDPPARGRAVGCHRTACNETPSASRRVTAPCASGTVRAVTTPDSRRRTLGRGDRLGIVPASEAWTLAFAGPDASGGFVRLTRWAEQAWYWAYLVSPASGLVVVRDHELAPPRRGGPLVVRGEGIWAELVEETPDEHWSVGLEAFGVRLADPLDAERGERGDRLPVGIDVEWETGHGSFGRVDGEVALGAARAGVAATGRFEHTGRGRAVVGAEPPGVLAA